MRSLVSLHSLLVLGAIWMSAAGCSEPEAPVPAVDAGPALETDAGAPTTGLFRPPPEAAPVRVARRCGSEPDAFHLGELDVAALNGADFQSGALIGREPVFVALTPGPSASAGLLFIDRDGDPWYRVYGSANVAATAAGNGFVMVDGSGGELATIDPRTRSIRLRQSFDGFGPDIAIAPVLDGFVVASGGLTYTTFSATLEATEAPPVEVALELEARPRERTLVRTDAGVVLLGHADCGVVTHWLDESGAPADEPYCLRREANPTSAPHWDGSRIVWTFEDGVMELDGRGYPDAFTDAVNYRPMAAFGLDDGLVVLRDRGAGSPFVRAVVVSRNAGGIVAELGAPGAETTALEIGNAAVALREGQARFVYRLAAGARVGSVVVDCQPGR